MLVAASQPCPSNSRKTQESPCPRDRQRRSSRTAKGGSPRADLWRRAVLHAAAIHRDLAGVDVVVWGIPFDAAVSNRPGARFGPQAIRRASAIFDGDPQYPFLRDPFDDLAVIDYGDCLLDYGNHPKTPGTIEARRRRS